MVPDIELQLQVVSAALRNVAAQAGQGGSLAGEQMGLSIATLDQVRALLPVRRRIARAELDAAIAMAQDLAAIIPGDELAAGLARARAVHGDVNADAGEADAARLALSEALASVADSLPDGETGKAAMRAVLSHSRRVIDIARACCLPAGFEVDPAEQQRLAKVREDLLAG